MKSKIKDKPIFHLIVVITWNFLYTTECSGAVVSSNTSDRLWLLQFNYIYQIFIASVGSWNVCKDSDINISYVFNNKRKNGRVRL